MGARTTCVANWPARLGMGVGACSLFAPPARCSERNRKILEVKSGKMDAGDAKRPKLKMVSGNQNPLHGTHLWFALLLGPGPVRTRLARRRISKAVSRRSARGTLTLDASVNDLGPWRQRLGCPAQSRSIKIAPRRLGRRNFNSKQTRSTLYLIPRPSARHPVPILRRSVVRHLLALNVPNITLDACFRL